jgi:hypothetical protein
LSQNRFGIGIKAIGQESHGVVVNSESSQNTLAFLLGKVQKGR